MTYEKAFNQAKEALAQGKYADASMLLHRALDKLEKAAEDGGPGSKKQRFRASEGAIRARLGHCLRLTGKFGEARKEFECVKAIAQELEDDGLMAEALMGLGFVAWRSDEHREARALFNDAIMLANKKHYRAVKGMALMGLGNLDLVCRKLNEGVKVYEQACPILAALPEARTDYARLLHNLAFLYYKNGDSDKAVETFKRSLEISDSLGDVHISGYVLTNMALMHLLSDKVAEGEKELEKAGRLLARSNDRIGLNFVTWVQGILKYKKGDLDGAMAHYRKARRGFEELGMAAQILNMTIDYVPAIKAAGQNKEVLDVLGKLKAFYVEKDYPEMASRVDEAIKMVK